MKGKVDYRTKKMVNYWTNSPKVVYTPKESVWVGDESLIQFKEARKK